MANNLYGLRHAEPVTVNWLSARTAHEAAGLPELGDLPIAALYPRQTTSSTSNGSPTSTSDRPYFPTDIPPANDGDDDDGPTSGSLAKVVLEYALLAVGLVVIGCFVLHRLSRLRRANQPASAFFSFSSFRSTDRYHPSQRPRYPRTHGLHRVHLAYPLPTHTLPVRSADVDPFGRRLGVGDFNDKDQLPAYELAGGPPKYFELHPNGSRPTTAGTSVGGEHPASPGDPGPGSSDSHDDHEESRGQGRPPDFDDHQVPQIRSSPPGLNSTSDHPQSNSITTTSTSTENVGRNESQLRNEHVD